MLVRLLYASHSAKHVSAEVIESILEQSRKHNPRLGTTGILCQSGEVFMQVLEGVRGAVNHLYNQIVRDERHRDVVVLHYEAAKKCSRVTAVEPLTADLLVRNALLNRADIRVLRAALGDGSPVEISWDGCRAVVPSYPLRDIISMAGGCDFLKCDCEGAEWLIDPADLSGIRRIEMELHQPPLGPAIRPALLDSIADRYEFSIDRNPVNGPYGQMGILHAWLH